MTSHPDPLRRLREALTALPGIGPKAADRILLALLRWPKERVRVLGRALAALPEAVSRCERCARYDAANPCAICRDRRRDATVLCVVAQASDVEAIEKSEEFHGLFHVLHGQLDPVEGVTPDQLNLASLLRRLDREPVREVILALNPTVEGETTALYLAKALKGRGLRLTKLARGLPLGAELEYADEVTLADALRGRREVQ